MKKIMILFVIMLMLVTVLFFLTGCDYSKFINNLNIPNEIDNLETETTTNSQGQIYERLSLNDKNINMFNTIVPKGWTAKIYSKV